MALRKRDAQIPRMRPKTRMDTASEGVVTMPENPEPEVQLTSEQIVLAEEAEMDKMSGMPAPPKDEPSPDAEPAKEPGKAEPEGKDTAEPEKEPVAPQAEPLTPEQISERLKSLLGTKTPESALKRAEDQSSEIGKKGAEVAKLRKQNDTLAAKVDLLSLQVAGGRSEPTPTQISTGKEVEIPKDMPDPVLDPDGFAKVVTGLVGVGIRNALPAAVEAAVGPRMEVYDAKVNAQSVAKHEGDMRLIYGDAWGAFADERKALADSMDREFHMTGTLADGKISPMEGYQLMALGKVYLEALKRGDIVALTVPSPKGGMGPSATGAEPQEPNAKTMEQLAKEVDEPLDRLAAGKFRPSTY